MHNSFKMHCEALLILKCRLYLNVTIVSNSVGRTVHNHINNSLINFSISIDDPLLVQACVGQDTIRQRVLFGGDFTPIKPTSAAF
jgi:hypothetical protein